MTETAKVQCSHVYKWYGTTSVLQDAVLSVRDHEFLCIVGPSGCGKTTLLRMMAGLTDVDHGDVLIDNVQVTKPPSNVAMVFQHFGLFPWKTVFRNVAFPLDIRNRDKAEINELVTWAVELVGLKGSETKYPWQLSGGMRQRVGLARALVYKPDILLMDEPFAAVDAQVREILQEELLNIWNKYRQTVVFITHSIDEAITLADRVVVMGTHPGRVVGDITIDIERPRTISTVRRHHSYMPLRDEIWSMLRNNEGEVTG